MKAKFLAAIVMVFMFSAGWYMMLSTAKENEDRYVQNLENARAKAEIGITSDAQAYYMEALGARESIELRVEILEYYKQYPKSYNDTIKKWIEEMIEVYPKESTGYEHLARIYYDTGSYELCFQTIERARARKSTSLELESMYESMKYFYTLSDTKYAMAGNYYMGFAIALTDGGSYGYVSGTGNMAIRKFTKVTPFSSDGYAVVSDGEETYIINKNGDKKYVDVERLDYQDFGMITEGLISLCREGSYYYADINFNKVFGDYDFAGVFNGGVAVVEKNGKWYLIDNGGNRISEREYDDILMDEKRISFRNKIAFAKMNEAYYMIGINGEKVSETSYEDACVFAGNQPTAVKKDGKWCFIKEDGSVTLTGDYEEARPFSNGFAAVKIDGKWGYIEQNGEIVIEPIYEDISEMGTSGKAMVKINGVWKTLAFLRNP